jgi:hypothetical protein
VNEAILKRGIRLVGPALNRPERGSFLFKSLSIGREQQNGVMVSFSKRRAREGLIIVAEVRITMIQGFTSPGCTINMLIEFRESCFQISLVKNP